MKNFKNEERRIGVELEFYGLTPFEAANSVSKVTGGKVVRITDDVVNVESADGRYRLETDALFIKKLSRTSEEFKEKKGIHYEDVLKSLISIISGEFVPTELITPPLLISELPKVVKIHQDLYRQGAQGSIESARFAFGAQLNPDVLSLESDSILRYFKAYLLSSAWLKNQIQMDTTRFLTFFASDFPKKYQLKIFEEDYRPSIEELIDDYLEDNPTRNRSLDLLPLFAFIDEKRVRAGSKNQKLNPRPTFHYRLPNCQLSLDSWEIGLEWKRWMMVEKLAENEKIFKKMSRKYRNLLKEDFLFHSSEWLIDSNNYMESLRT